MRKIYIALGPLLIVASTLLAIQFAIGVPGDQSTVDYAGVFNSSSSRPYNSAVSPIPASDRTFTVETWVKPGNAPADGYQVIFGQNLLVSGCPTGRFGLMLNRVTDGAANYNVHVAIDNCGIFTSDLHVAANWRG